MDPVSRLAALGPALDPAPGRRSFFRWLTYGLGAVAAAAVGLPFVGYLFGARKAPVKWVALGRVDDFPPGETRLVTFDNPIRQPWDGMVAHTGVYRPLRGPRRAEADETKAHSSWSSPSTAPTWAARSSGSRSRACSCARATAASITPTANAPPARRRAGSSIASGG